MDDKRPNPDELLAQVQAQEAKKHRGKLKIFFGAAAGVGKTYSMLEAAQTLRKEGVDVVAGYIEPHNRPETAAMLEGLETIPAREMDYRGSKLREFDLDAALARHPHIILVDELAHTNAPDSRHAKRWQDVEELLEVGINVYTTVNVQHLESLNDVIAQITGTIVRETIPDSLLENADDVELIDLPPDELLKRLREGKIYLPQQAERAIDNFFRKGNLMALRELSLRRTAERVDSQMQNYRRDKAVAQIWPAGERIIVCISPSPLSARLVRAAKRMAAGFHAEWLAVYVENPRARQLSDVERNRVIQTLRLAEQLGAETVTLTGDNLSEEILTYARKHNVTKIIVGKPLHSPWRDLFFGSVLNDLIRKSGSVDVYVISGDESQSKSPALVAEKRLWRWADYAQALLLVLVCTLIAAAMYPFFAPANLIMLYLVGIVIVSSRNGRGPSIMASILSVLAFDFFYIPPHLTFAVSDTQYIVTFAVMLLVGLTISSMTVRIRRQAESAREREQRSSRLYEMSRDFASNSEVETLVEIAIQHIEAVFETQTLVFLLADDKSLRPHGSEEARNKLTDRELGAASWAYQHGQEAGFGTATLPAATGLYLPLLTPKGKVGVLGMYYRNAKYLPSPEQMHLLEIFSNQTALAIERASLTEETEQARIQIETERLRNALLSSVSHDLRTPLAAITGAASGLLQREVALDANGRELAEIAYEEAERLNRLLGNLLEMTRIESGTVQVNKEWQPLEEVIGSTLLRLEGPLAQRSLKTKLPDDLPLVPIDTVLIEQVLVNLLENALKYTPPESPIDLSAWLEEEQVIVELADRGAGIKLGDEERIFDKFYRQRPTVASGVGLGLTICRAIVEAHGGRIWAANRSDGGAAFRFTLPLDGEPPHIDIETE
jgi:two-component system sensor histidine kinase KdpD